MANFLVQKGVTDVLDKEETTYHIGITHTTNKRFWEFNKSFRERITSTRPQAIEMECATLFAGSYAHKLPLGALLLVSDLPLDPKKIKTKESSEEIYRKYTLEHVELGIKIAHRVQKMIKKEAKGVFRGHRKRFEREEVLEED